MVQWITWAIESSGYLGIALLMLAENVFPPVPSEVIMPLAGYMAAKGELRIELVILAGGLGSLAGATLWYFIGQHCGQARLERWAARHGRWLTMTPDEVRLAARWFHDHGALAVLVGRLIPAIRTLISVPAGISAMALPAFFLASGIGTALWTSLLALGGYGLGQSYGALEQWLAPVTNVILAALLIGYVYRVATFRRADGATSGGRREGSA